MAKPTSPAADTPSPTQTISGHRWLLRLVLVLFALQFGWLTWQLRGDIEDLTRRLYTRAWGPAVRQEDPFYLWIRDLNRIVPPQAAYLFLDNYEAGKEIEARYHLYPRQHLLLLPDSPPSQLFYTLRQYQVTYIFVRDAGGPLGSGLKAALDLGAAERLELPGPGLVYRVDPTRISGGFYD